MNTLPPILGEDSAFLGVIEEIARLSTIDRPCLVVGERGTGKELLTSRLHYLSQRWEAPLIKINCAALSESLLESELFGHEAGAFTGAQRRHIGRFERAHGGTLVLDEIATASAAVQENVLRIIEYGEFERVGGSETIRIDVRVIGSTNVDLPDLAHQGRFRADLLDRLSFAVVTVPPLRARPADILALANEFGRAMTRVLHREVFPGFSSNAERTLLEHPWRGNVRELKNVVERAVWQTDQLEHTIEIFNIDPFESPWRPGRNPVSDKDTKPLVAIDTGIDFAEHVATYEKTLISQALEQTHYNQTEAAELLDLSYHQLRRLTAKHQLRP